MAGQFCRYTVVGGAAFMLDAGILWLLTEYGKLYYLWSAALAFVAGLAVNYLLCRCWVFSLRTYQCAATEFSLFAGIGLLGLGGNELLLWFFTQQWGCYYLYSKMLAAVCIFCGNFYLRKMILFQGAAER